MPSARTRTTPRATRVAWVTSHPVQYQAPLLRALGAHDSIDLTVIYLSDVSLHSYRDPGFGTQVAWDVDLSTGTKTMFLSSMQSEPPGPLTPWVPRLERVLRRGRFDRVVVNGYNKQGFLRAMIAGRLLGATVYHRGESHLLSSPRAGKFHIVKALAMPLLFRIPHGFLSIGARNTEYYRRFGVPRERINVAPYGVDNDYFASGAALDRVEAIRRDLGLSGKRVVLFASKLMTRKGPQHLLEAFRILERDHEMQDVHLLFVGEGEEWETLRRGATKRTHLLGFKNQSELPALYALADVFVLPARHEAWGLAVNEAMSVGTPCIVGETVGCVPDLIIEGVTGLTVPFGEPLVLADRIRTALASRWDRAKISEHVAPFGARHVAAILAQTLNGFDS